MKSNSIIIDFIGDDYIEYSDFWENTYQNLSIDSQILYDSLHSNVIYNIFDEIKLYIRENFAKNTSYNVIVTNKQYNK